MAIIVWSEMRGKFILFRGPSLVHLYGEVTEVHPYVPGDIETMEVIRLNGKRYTVEPQDVLKVYDTSYRVEKFIRDFEDLQAL